MTSGQISEAQFELQVKHLAQLSGWLYYHTHRSQFSPSGFPDCAMVRPPRVVYAELKKEGGQPTPEQFEWLNALAEANQEVYLWYPSDFKEIQEVLYGRT